MPPRPRSPRTRVSRPTLTSLARDLNVSPSTVSNAFNRPDQLSSELRGRILAAAESAGFGGPDPVARSLRYGTAEAHAVLFAESLPYAFTDPAAVLFLEGLSTALAAADLALVLLPGIEGRPSDPRGVMRALVDGFAIYSVPGNDPRTEAARRRGLPLVIVDQPRGVDEPFIGIDDRAAARAVGENVVAHGHRRLGVIAFNIGAEPRWGPADLERQASRTYDVTHERLAGFREAVDAAGQAWSDVLVQETVGNTVDGGRRAAHALLGARPRPTAILAHSDLLALGTLQAARELGLRVPDELSLTGFDDIPAAATAAPRLTTIRQPHLDKGRLAADALLSPEGPQLRRRLLPWSLVIGNSTGPAPLRGA